MKIRRVIVSLFLLSFVSQTVFAGSEQTVDQVGYYEVDSNSAVSTPQFALLALNHLNDLIQPIETLGTKVVQLLNWQYFNRAIPQATEPYNRKTHFGTWIVDRSENPKNCYNTRAEVLIRDSEVPTQDTGGEHCTVTAGQWQDPYAGSEISVAKDVQIDHVVALKNAYVSGAFQWSWKQRCLYANFMGNRFQLLSVLGSENLRKLDYGPEKWMPLNPAFRCQHLKNWLTIKMIWSMWMTPVEANAIQKEMVASNCDKGEFFISYKDLIVQRQYIAKNQDLCTRQPQSSDSTP